ncbi:MAG: hypothetical protein KC589_04385 [Nanoarchaeota archaeon]|nr:hypothetical protein [Nanoarchaeota archaeon]
MNWKTKKIKIGELIPYEKNPRVISEKQRTELIKSLKKFNLVELPVINLDNKIIAGHQRLSILLDVYGPDLEVEVRVPDKLLNEKDYEEYLIRSNRNTGDWDWNMLDSFNKDDLLNFGFEEFEVGVDKVELDKIFEDMNKDVKTKQSSQKCPCCNNKIKYKITIIKNPVEELKDLDLRLEISKEIVEYLLEKNYDVDDIYILKK